MSRSSLMLLVLLLLMPCGSMSADVPAGMAKHIVMAADQRAIADLLEGYTRAVSNGDEAAFSRLLLNEDIPFFATYGLARRTAGQPPLDVRQYRDFRDAVFRNDQHLTQRFSNVYIEQDGELAAVSLDFVTLDAGTTSGSYGWKTLQLVKDAGTWKIASEFYSAYTLE